MIVYDVATKILDTEYFPQHNIASLISGITFIVLFQSGEAFTVGRNTHTHTHTHTHTQTLNSSNDMLYQVPKKICQTTQLK